MLICLLVEGAFRSDSRAARIAGALSAAEHEVVIVTTAPSDDLAPANTTVLAPPRVVPGTQRLPRLTQPARRAAAARRARARTPDAVHVVGCSMLPAGVRIAKRAHATVVLDRAPDDMAFPRGATALRRERGLLRDCAAVITASESDTLALRERHDLSASPVVCRDIAEPPPYSPTPANLRQRLRLGDAPLALVHGDEPGFEQCVGAVKALAACPDAHLVLLGADGWRWADQIQLEAERLRCAARFHLLRSVPLKRLPAYANDADVGLCLSSGEEPSRLLSSVYRYAGAGLPVIVPPASEGELVVRRFDFGWVAEPTDVETMSVALELACGSERGTRQDAAARAGSLLTWSSEAQVLVGLYQRLAAIPERVIAPEPGRVGATRTNMAAVAREWRSRRERGVRTDTRGFVHYVRGRELRGRGRYAQSVTYFERALERNPGDVASAQLRAASLKDANRSVEAIEAYRQLLDGQPSKTNTIAVNAAINLARLGVQREPRSVLDTLSSRARTAAEFARSAELAAALGDVMSAREAVERAAALTPDDPALTRVECRVLEQAGEPERALAAAVRRADAQSIARLGGVLRAYDATWLPDPPPGGPVQPVDGRVLHLLETSLPHATTGYSYRTRTVLAAQRAYGLTPVAATRLGFPANRGIDTFSSTEVVEGVVHHRFTLPGVRRYTSVPPDEQLRRNALLLGGLVEAVRPAALHATTPHHNGLLGLSLRKTFGTPLIYEVRGFPEMTWAVRTGGDGASVYQLRRAAETRCMLEADAVVTLSEVMKRHIVGRGVPADHVWVVPHMVDTQAIRPSDRDPELVQRYGLEGKSVVGYLGTLVDYEGLDLLLGALAKLRDQRPALQGLIVGSGPAEPALRALAKELGVEDRVVFAGRIPHSMVNQHVALFDLYVLPRRDLEVCRWVTPLKPYEAMASRRCVLTSDVDALAETVSEDCGATFPAGDPDALADAIRELAADHERRERLADNGRNKIIARHDEARLAAMAAAPIASVTHGQLRDSE